jgi:Fe-Mn family superoxide dismutase
MNKAVDAHGAEGASMATAASTSSSLSLPPLPYAANALEPVILAQTLSFHHGRHHRAYVEKLIGPWGPLRVRGL